MFKRVVKAAEELLSNVAERTLIDFERGARNPYDRTLSDIRRALEEAGLMFIEENGGAKV